MISPYSTVVPNGKVLFFCGNKINSLETVISPMTESSPACISDQYKNTIMFILSIILDSIVFAKLLETLSNLLTTAIAR